MNSYSILAFNLIVISVVAMFGGFSGYTVDGVPQGGAIESAPGLLSVVSWVWGSITFLFDMAFFRVDGMPEFMSLIFLLFTTLTVFLIVKLIRGSGD